MDLVELVDRRAGGPIDATFVRQLAELPQSLLSNEQDQLEASHRVVTDAYTGLGARHASDFVGAHNTMDRIRSLSHSLIQGSADCMENVAQVPRAGDLAFTAARSLVTDELQLYLEVSKAQDLLQLPEMVRTCVSESQFGAALDLAALAGRLRTRYPNVQTVARVAADVDTLVAQVRTQLEKTLRESSRLPQLIRSVALLRRIPSSSSTASPVEDLQRKFLISRREYLEGQWARITTLSAPQYLKRYVELFREHVFATITGHATIFETEARAAALAEFTRGATSQLIEKLRVKAPEITEPSERSALWLQLAFCSHSLGRVGASFWPVLGLLTSSNVLSEAEWRDAYDRQQDMARQAAKAAAT